GLGPEYRARAAGSPSPRQSAAPPPLRASTSKSDRRRLPPCRPPPGTSPPAAASCCACRGSPPAPLPPLRAAALPQPHGRAAVPRIQLQNAFEQATCPTLVEQVVAQHLGFQPQALE